MSLSFFQIILALIAFLFLFNTFSKFLKGERGQTFFKLLLSLFVWGGILSLSLFPTLGLTLSTTLGLGSNLNTLIFIGFVIVFIVLFKFMSIIERIERTLSEIIRKEALKDIKK